MTARAICTLDVLSGGRVTLGSGVGWLQPEFEIVGESWTNRGARCNEIITILRLLWTEDEPEFHGTHYDFGPVKFEPKPVQRPTPPVLVSGGSKAALHRAARQGDGWIADPATASDHDAISSKISELARLRAEHGRADIPFEIQAGIPVDSDREVLHRLEDIGVTRVTVRPWSPPPPGADHLAHGLNDLERVAERFL